MKISIKPTYLFLILAFAFVSCAQNELLGPNDSEGRRILFRTSLPELNTRAEVITAANLPYFHVTAFDTDDRSKGVQDTLFANRKIEIIRGEEFFSSPQCCWPDPTKESDMVSFFGFYPDLEKSGGAELLYNLTPDAIDYKLSGFRVAGEISEQSDFISAYASGNMADNLFSGITLNFAHQLSRIEVKAHGTHKSCDIEIAGVRIGGTGIENTFDFKPIDGGGVWSGKPVRGIVEYVYREGDKIVTCGKNNPVKVDNAVSIMGSKRADGNDNCALLIPGNYDQWDSAKDRSNGNNQMYISVLIRITDATLTAGENPVQKQRYPYLDLSQGADSYDIPKEYFAVNKTTGVVSAHVYKSGSSYFTDSKCTLPYTLQDSDEIKEFGWAALPIKGNWKPGNIYTYTLDYTVGVGLHDPAVTTSAPGAGDAIISDKVGISYNVTEWKSGGGSNFEVPGF